MSGRTRENVKATTPGYPRGSCSDGSDRNRNLRNRTGREGLTSLFVNGGESSRIVVCGEGTGHDCEPVRLLINTKPLTPVGCSVWNPDRTRS